MPVNIVISVYLRCANIMWPVTAPVIAPHVKRPRKYYHLRSLTDRRPTLVSWRKSNQNSFVFIWLLDENKMGVYLEGKAATFAQLAHKSSLLCGVCVSSHQTPLGLFFFVSPLVLEWLRVPRKLLSLFDFHLGTVLCNPPERQKRELVEAPTSHYSLFQIQKSFLGVYLTPKKVTF